MSRLIVLSNRVKMLDNSPMPGGLAVALHDLLEGQSVIWMGWNGSIADSDNSEAINEFSSDSQHTGVDQYYAHKNITYITTALTSTHYEQFYCGFAISVLWSLLHERADLVTRTADDYKGYQEVNRLFAKQLKKIIQPDDVIWVHDYHFLSVAYHCRTLGINNRIGFFLHIPFAPLSCWQVLEQSPELLKHLAHYDVLGTQTHQDKANAIHVFQHYLRDNLLEDSPLKTDLLRTNKEDNLQHNVTRSNCCNGIQRTLNLDFRASHCLLINAYPIGVNVAKIQQQVSQLSSAFSASSVANLLKTNLPKSHAQRIIAVDRIDYSKGLLERISAYRHFLQHNPAYQNQIEFLQIACPSRLALPIYQRFYQEVKHAVDVVNQQFLPSEYSSDAALTPFEVGNFQVSNFNTSFHDTIDYKMDSARTTSLVNHWQAITYSEEVHHHEALMTAFSRSDIGWVNSLKDGMNLVAKEYIAAQNPDHPGVLLLSRYAGAAEQMQAAVIIDPHQPMSIVTALKTALTMPLAERKSRYQTLMHGLEQDDLQAWQQRFLDDLYDTKRR